MYDVTSRLNRIISEHAEVGEAFAFIIASKLLGRETLSAALGEISEHLVATFIGGARKPRGNYGFDLIGPNGERIEVKSRQLSRWGEGLMFDFSRHSANASEAFCVAWDDTVSPPVVHAAFRASIPELLSHWGTPNSPSYAIRTTLKKLRSKIALEAEDLPT